MRTARLSIVVMALAVGLSLAALTPSVGQPGPAQQRLSPELVAALARQAAADRAAAEQAQRQAVADRAVAERAARQAAAERAAAERAARQAAVDRAA
ncbi:MAG TPA: hypothetical protein VES64_04305, partial [Allosphingosinicella sp.]|nr:hypothetical protein [Allosphingosinicella sp.]